jgi:hypothetical protein
MKGFIVSAIIGFNYFIGIYYGVVQVIYSTLLAIALVVILQHISRIRYAPFRDLEKRSER